MSDRTSFFSYEAERALEGDSETAQRLFLSSTTQSQYSLSTEAPTTRAIGPYSISGGYSVNHPYMTYPAYSQPGDPYAASQTFTNSPPHASFPSGPMGSPQYPSTGNFQQPTYGSSRSESPDPGDLTNYGIQNPDGTWSCGYPGCSSHVVFTRACDLRKHFNRHNKYLFCRYDGCPQATEGGFSSKKDRARHEAKHNPEVMCEWEGCDRIFSRVDNMKDHVRRIHKRREFE